MNEQPPKLSILLATVIQRADLFAKLHDELQRQAQGKRVELVVACDNKEISIGKKRQNLLEAAKGDYVCYIDDDDWISPTYVDQILKALETSPDCVGFRIQCTMNGGAPQMAIASRRYPHWGDNQDGARFVRSCYHKTPHLRSIGLQVGFPDLRYGEDRIYSEGLMKHVKTESFIDSVLYLYRFRNEPFHAKYGIPRAAKMHKGINYGHVRKPFQH